jgi:hypothetical protein
MSKQRSDRFQEAWAVVRIDNYDVPGSPKESDIVVKEVWLTEQQADREVGRLNALWAERHPDNDSTKYFAQYTRLERERET